MPYPLDLSAHFGADFPTDITNGVTSCAGLGDEVTDYHFVRDLLDPDSVFGSVSVAIVAIDFDS
jgi:hypothetical protein